MKLPSELNIEKQQSSSNNDKLQTHTANRKTSVKKLSVVDSRRSSTSAGFWFFLSMVVINKVVILPGNL